MGVRGIDELLTVLPSAAAEPAAAVAAALSELQAVRHAALRPEEVLALGEVFERFTAQVASARLAVVAAIDARDDVIPKAKVGEAGAVFACHALGQRRWVARRDGLWAGLLRPEVGDLPAIGAAFAAGDVTTAHVEVAVRTHKELGSAVREVLMGCRIPDGDDDITDQLRIALEGLSDAFTTRVRLIRVVDAVLAHYARRFTVTELEAIAKRIVATLKPPDPKGAHEQRYLHMSQLPDGRWVGKFSCGPDQGLRLKRGLAAFSEPRPGKAIDADGVEHQIPDVRDLGARQMDAVTDILNLALAKTGITLPTEAAGASTTSPPAGDGAGDPETGQTSPASATPSSRGASPSGPPDAPQEPPPGEGEAVVLREPGALVAPYPSADLVLVAGIEHAAAAWAQRSRGLPVNLEGDLDGWLRGRFPSRFRPRKEQPDRRLREGPTGERLPQEQSPTRGPEGETPAESGEDPFRQAPPAESSPAEDENTTENCDRRRERGDGKSDLTWLGRALSPYGVPARVEHAGLVDATTLELLACNAIVRAALLAPNGALLDLGRSQRLATAAQKTALLARDGGCVIPGCLVPGDACDAHHVQWWQRGGRTDLENLALVCGRHHTEVHLEEWEIRMLDGIPWVVPPRWVDPARRPLRNAAHHPRSNRSEAA